MEKRQRLRRLAIQTYGNKCVCCGETRYLFLTFDHKNNDGYKTRRKGGIRFEGVVFYTWLLEEHRPDIEVACWNCNCGRAMNGGVCPHKTSEAE